MKYIINHQITFCNENRTLSLLNNVENSLVLSAPASRLLLTLIINKNTPLTREYLLTTVWEDYGFTASGSNLNNYISELRKCLTHLEPNFAGIITIPKVGFQFIAHIETLLSEHLQPENVTTLHIASPLLTPDDNTPTGNEFNNTNKNFKKKPSQQPYDNRLYYLKLFIKKNTVVLIMITLPLIIIMIYLYLISHNEIGTENSRLIFTKDNCSIYALDEFTILSNEEIIQKIENDLNGERINCNNNNQYDIYYSYLSKSESRLYNTEFIGVCLKNNNKEYIHKNCYSISNEIE